MREKGHAAVDGAEIPSIFGGGFFFRMNARRTHAVEQHVAENRKKKISPTGEKERERNREIER